MNDVTPYQAGVAEAPRSAQEHRLHAVPMMATCEDGGQRSFRHLEYFFFHVPPAILVRKRHSYQGHVPDGSGASSLSPDAKSSIRFCSFQPYI